MSKKIFIILVVFLMVSRYLKNMNRCTCMESPQRTRMT